MPVPQDKIGVAIPRWDPDKTQLMQDVWDVFMYKTKSITSFPEERQKKIVASYRFLSVAFPDPYTIRCRMTPDTMDLV